LVLRYLHARVIPMTEIQLGPSKPGIWSRIGAPVFSWMMAIGSAVLIKILSDVLSQPEIITEFGELIRRLFGSE